jgi:hypothetical protein
VILRFVFLSDGVNGVEALYRCGATLLSADTMIFICDQQFKHQQFRRLVEGIAFMSNESPAN